ISFDAVGHRVHAGGGGNRRRQGQGQVGIDYGDVGYEILADYAFFQFGLGVGQNRDGGDLAARARRGGDADQPDIAAGNLSDADDIQGLLPAVEEDRHQFREVQGRSAAYADDGFGGEFPDRSQQYFQGF